MRRDRWRLPHSQSRYVGYWRAECCTCCRQFGRLRCSNPTLLVTQNYGVGRMTQISISNIAFLEERIPGLLLYHGTAGRETGTDEKRQMDFAIVSAQICRLLQGRMLHLLPTSWTFAMVKSDITSVTGGQNAAPVADKLDGREAQLDVLVTLTPCLDNLDTHTHTHVRPCAIHAPVIVLWLRNNKCWSSPDSQFLNSLCDLPRRAVDPVSFRSLALSSLALCISFSPSFGLFRVKGDEMSDPAAILGQSRLRRSLCGSERSEGILSLPPPPEEEEDRQLVQLLSGLCKVQMAVPLLRAG
ncbi:hypothetical protein J6590_025384 [Homalodisca vitripennis]|nr:hypothetical protein J6590_025384 [Homalodisca vitripennis]